MLDSLKYLCKKYESIRPKLIILFGSRARGDFLEYSDVDVLVVADILPKDPRKSFEELYDPNEPHIMPIGMNTEVFLKKLQEGSTFILEVIEDGKILCGEEEFINYVLSIFRRIRRLYERRGRAWIRAT